MQKTNAHMNLTKEYYTPEQIKIMRMVLSSTNQCPQVFFTTLDSIIHKTGVVKKMNKKFIDCFNSFREENKKYNKRTIFVMYNFIQDEFQNKDINSVSMSEVYKTIKSKGGLRRVRRPEFGSRTIDAIEDFLQKNSLL